MVGSHECGVEQAWLGAGEVEVCPADCPQPESGACGCLRSRTDLAHPVGHAPSELSDRLLADRREQRVTIGEVPVRGIGNYADHARYLAQHDRVRTARSGELDAGLDQGRPDSAAGPRPAAARPIVRLRVTHLTR
jgi:hypothetical protein